MTQEVKALKRLRKILGTYGLEVGVLTSQYSGTRLPGTVSFSKRRDEPAVEFEALGRTIGLGLCSRYSLAYLVLLSSTTYRQLR